MIPNDINYLNGLNVNNKKIHTLLNLQIIGVLKITCSIVAQKRAELSEILNLALISKLMTFVSLPLECTHSC